MRNLGDDGDDGDVLDLTVWGVFPAMLRNIMHRAVKLLVCQHYPLLPRHRSQGERHVSLCRG